LSWDIANSIAGLNENELIKVKEGELILVAQNNGKLKAFKRESP